MYRIIATFSVVTLVWGASRFPSDIPRCRISDTNCLRSSAEKVFVVFTNGNTELGVPPLDPITMSTFIVNQQPGPISLQQEYNDVRMTGFSKAKVQQFIINLDEGLINVKLSLPHLAGQSRYMLKGQLLLFPIDTKGMFQLDLMDFSMQANCTCEIIRKQDANYLHITSVKIIIAANTLKFNFGTLIQGNEQLDKEVHKIIDQDPAAFFEVVRPAAQGIWGSFLHEVLNTVFMQTSMEELFIK